LLLEEYETIDYVGEAWCNVCLYYYVITVTFYTWGDMGFVGVCSIEIGESGMKGIKRNNAKYEYREIRRIKGNR